MHSRLLVVETQRPPSSSGCLISWGHVTVANETGVEVGAGCDWFSSLLPFTMAPSSIQGGGATGSSGDVDSKVPLPGPVGPDCKWEINL